MAEETEHWTKKVFFDESYLFLPTLVERVNKAEEEAEGLTQILRNQKVPGSGLILDLACGIGRHDPFLSQNGFYVIGVDISPEFLRRAKLKAKHADKEKRCIYMLSDMRYVGNLFRGRTFDAVISMFTSLGYYDKDTDQNILNQINTISKPHGLLIVDMMTKDYGERLNGRRIVHPSKDGIIRIEKSCFNLKESILKASWEYYEQAVNGMHLINNISFRNILYSPDEFEAMLNQVGWNLIENYSDFSLSEYVVESKYMIIVASVKNPNS